MELSTFKIKADGIKGQVIKDGVDISNEISSIKIDIRAGELPMATVSFIVSDIELSVSDVLVKEKPAEKWLAKIKRFLQERFCK